MAREPLKMVGVGGTGSGKTHTSYKYLKDVYSNPRNPNARKTLIYDTNMEFKDLKPLAPQDIKLFNQQKKIEIRRVLPIDLATGKELGMDEKYELLCEIIDVHNFRNGLLYLEDINNYITGISFQKHLINLLTTNRHKLLDIFINLQTFRALPPRLWGNINVLRIHKTNDSPFQNKIKDQIAGQMKPLRVAHLLVDEITKTDKYFYVTVNFTTLKITGKFSMEQYIDACKGYLALNPREVKNYVTLNNVSKDEATDKLIVNLVHNYNGNVELKQK